METFFNELINQPSLAPAPRLQENIYKPQNFSDNDAKMLASIAQSNIEAIESSIGALTHLINNLKIYKQCVIDSINLQAEGLDIISKYANDTPSQPYNLPGVINQPSSYDIQGIKDDNTRMEQTKTLGEKAVKQKRIYLRLSEEDLKVFNQSWRKLLYSNASFEEFMESINGSINRNY